MTGAPVIFIVWRTGQGGNLIGARSTLEAAQALAWTSTEDGGDREGVRIDELIVADARYCDDDLRQAGDPPTILSSGSPASFSPGQVPFPVQTLCRRCGERVPHDAR